MGNPRTKKIGRSRRGALTVEFAVMAPLLILLFLGFTVLALGIFRYQQVAFLAREGARYASTHGAQYHADKKLAAGNQSSWQAEIRTNVIDYYATVLDPSAVTMTATWSAGTNRANEADPNATPPYSRTIPNVVTVTVSYNWDPEAFIGGPILLTSKATMPITY